jgi:hypothetical protein
VHSADAGKRALTDEQTEIEMPELADKIADAKAELERLERLAASATCADLGHDWQSIGGCNAGCDPNCSCSVPVNECTRCKDCDYGQNEEAAQVRRDCRMRTAAVLCDGKLAQVD